jgi:hypothetical protein
VDKKHTTLYKENTMNFANLKKQSKDFNGLLKQVEKMNGGGGNFEKEDTDNYWKPTPDKTGNALAVIRFLPGPAVDGDDALPWVRYFDHGFQNKVTGKWYIEKSLTTFDEKDPVSEYNSTLWNSTQDDNSPERKQARDQKRRLHYVSNIYVVSDPKNPENEGKVFLFKYGKKIFDKITKMMNPDLESEGKVNPFDLWQGAHFKLKVTRQNVNMGGRNVSFPNYDESVFLAPGPLSKDDDEMEAIWKREHSLKEIVDRKNFKTYAELKARLDDVNGLSTTITTPAPKVTKADIVEDEEVPFTNAKKLPVEDEEDEDLAMFRKLAED